MDSIQTSPTEAVVAGSKRLDQERVRQLSQETHDLLMAGETQSALSLFHELHPADQAGLLSGLTAELRSGLARALPQADIAKVLEHLGLETALHLLEGIDPSTLAHILDQSKPEVSADILSHLPPESAQATLRTMDQGAVVVSLLRYPPDSAGRIMSPTFPAVIEDATAADALTLLRSLGPLAEEFNSIPVVDTGDKLKGSLTVVRLALAQPDAIARNIMAGEVMTVTPEADQEECARIMEHYGLGQLLVVDSAGHLIGVIHGEDLVSVVEEEATEDMYRLAGIAGERVFGPFLSSVRYRLPWLGVNLATVFLSAFVISVFESTIAKLVTLAVFLPVIAGQAGIGGTQTLTLVVRAMALGEVSRDRGLQLLSREILLGVAHGALLGLVVGVLAYAWQGNAMLGLILGMAMLGNMVIAALTGAGTPLLLRRMDIDPALASAVIVTTFTDVMGFLLFLGLATALINFLL